MVGLRERLKMRKRFNWIYLHDNDVIIEICGDIGDAEGILPVLSAIFGLVFYYVQFTYHDYIAIICWTVAFFSSLRLFFNYFSLRILVMDCTEAILIMVDEHLGKHQRVRFAASFDAIATIALNHRTLAGSMETGPELNMDTLVIFFKNRPDCKVCTVDSSEVGELMKIQSAVLAARDAFLKGKQYNQHAQHREKDANEAERIMHTLSTISHWREHHALRTSS
jgi:hypothetical protein